MSWSWSNSPQSSPGFVYFNNPDSSSQGFIPFGDTPPQDKFAPRNYSSPQNRRSFNQQRGWNQNRFSGGKGKNKSFHGPYGNFNENYSPVSVPKFDNNYLIKVKFVQKSFLENPWEKLEEQLEEKRRNKQNDEVDGNVSQLSPNSAQKRSIDMID